MKPGFLDYTIYQGSEFEKVLTFKSSNDGIFNLTGYTFKLMAVESIGDSVNVIDSETDESNLHHITIADHSVNDAAALTAGVLVISMNAVQTASLTFNTAIWQLEGTKDGKINRFLQGYLMLDKETVI